MGILFFDGWSIRATLKQGNAWIRSWAGGRSVFSLATSRFVGRRLVIASLVYAKSGRILIESLAEDPGADETKKQISGNSFS